MAPISVSFVIPAYNEECYISSVIKAIQEECKPQNVLAEIIVVDNGSTDNTGEIAKSLVDNVYSIEKKSIACARNFGASKATQPVVAFIDGDTLVTGEWVESLRQGYEGFIDNPLFVTGDRARPPADASWLEKNWFDNLQSRYLGGANICTSKAAISHLGGFDEALITGEDYDFCERAVAEGLDFSKNSGFHAIHLGFPKTLKGFALREMWHGEGDFYSISRFLRSRVAIMALCYVFLQLLSILLFLVGWVEYGLVAVFVLCGVNAILTLKRFSGLHVRVLLANFFLTYVYFMARALSITKWHHKFAK